MLENRRKKYKEMDVSKKKQMLNRKAVKSRKRKISKLNVDVCIMESRIPLGPGKFHVVVLVQLTFLSFVVTAQRSKTHYVILRKTENNYELFGYSPAPLTNKERLNERGKAKPVFKSEHPRSVTQCNTVKLFSKLHFVHIKVVYI